MKKLYVLIIACIVAFVSNFNTKAQTLEFYENNTWYLDKQTAINEAKAQNKQVFICYGRMSCANTGNVRKLLGTESFRSLVDDTFVLWFINSDSLSRFSKALEEYMGFDVFPALSYTLPLLRMIYVHDINLSSSVSEGNKTAEQLKSYMLQYVANPQVTSIVPDIKVYVSGKTLTVNGRSTNETINVYSITGSLVGKFTKTEQNVTKDISSYPSGILIVSGSSGWTKKVINRK
jgi:hypothetical protein